MGANDMALVVGIGKYPTFGGNAAAAARDLHGPVNDADAFLDWLRNPSGGDVPSGHIFAVTSANLPAGATLGPILQHLTDTFDALKTLARQAVPRRRLYLYVSGHGYGRKRAEGGLYLADATPANLSNLFVSDYFHWFLDAGDFEECVLFCDACMDQGRLAAPAAMHWRREIQANQTKALGVYAARFAGRAVEGTMPNGQVHGAFSYALHMGLSGAAAVDDGQGGRVITSDSLRDYLIATMQKLMTEAQRQHPQISTEPDFGPFDTVTLVANAPLFTAPLRLRTPPRLDGTPLRLENAALAVLGRETPANGILDLTLSPGLYLLSDPGSGWSAGF